MFELADFLVGIYKVEDCTRSITIENFDKDRVLGIGEKEHEKENFLEDTSIMLESPKAKEVESELSVSQELQTSEITASTPMTSQIPQPI